MTGSGVPHTAPSDCHDLRVAVVAARWHTEIMEGLLDGARRALADHRIEAAVELRVPGSFELPVVAMALAKQGYDAIVALGVVVRGGTPHFEFVCSTAADGLSQVALDTGSAIGFGLLTCDTEEQARDRAGLPGSSEDKGYEAAQAAMLTAMTLKKIRQRDI